MIKSNMSTQNQFDLPDMDKIGMHPNWVSLATVYFERKIFIREGETTSNIEIKNKKYNTFSNNTLNGEDAKNIYNEIISTPGTSSKCTANSQQSPDIKDDRLKSNVTKDVPIMPNDKITQKFLLAAQENNTTVLSEILSKCPGVLNTTDSYGWTALMCSVQAEAFDSVKFLIDSDADISIKEKTGKSARNFAKKNVYIYKLLTDKRSEIKLARNVERNVESYREYQCDICKESYREPDKNMHMTSTVHRFCCNQNTKLKTVYGIPENNRGYQILLKNGWDRENGLGPKGDGKKFPLKTVHKVDRYGLGNKTETPRVTHTIESIKEKDKHRVETYKTDSKKYRKAKMSKERLLEQRIRRSLS